MFRSHEGSCDADSDAGPNGAGKNSSGTGDPNPVKIGDVTVETAPFELLQRATARHDAVAQQLEAAQSAVQAAAGPEAKAAARAALKKVRNEQMVQLQTERKAERQQYDTAETEADKASARGRLIVARLAIALVKKASGTAAPSEERRKALLASSWSPWPSRNTTVE